MHYPNRNSSTHPPSALPETRRARDHRYRAADYIVEALQAAGVDTLFGIPGGSIAPVYDALLEYPDINVVTTRHETSAVFAASAWARLTGKVGVVLVTSGPGILNAMNGIASARTDSTPVLILAGEAAREGFGRGAVQEGSAYGLNIVTMATQICKAAFELSSSEAAPFLLQHALRTASSGQPGPVLLSVPLDILSGLINRPAIAMEAPVPVKLASDDVESAARALKAPGRKVILAGSGARYASAELLALAERLGCSVMTTPKAKGVFPEDHPLALGVFGMGGHPSTSAFLEDGIDVLLAVGTSFNEVATDGWSKDLIPRRSLIHIEVNGATIGKVYATDIALVAPADVALRGLLDSIPETESSLPASSQLSYAFDAKTLEVLTGDTISAPRALWELQACLPEETIYTTDSGTNLFFAIHYLKIRRADAFISLLGLGSMGSGLPAALGAQLAAPDRKVVAVLGDGGLSMVAGELSTLAALKLPIVVAVLNDQRYGMVEFGMKAIFGRSPDFEMAPFDVVGVARSCGAKALTICKAEEISQAIAEAPCDRPLVLDIRIECGLGLPTNKRFQQITKNTQGMVN